MTDTHSPDRARTETHRPRSQPTEGPEDVGDRLPLPTELLDRLHGRLERSAVDQDLIDVAYRTVDSPVGRLLLASSRRGLVRVAFERQDFDATLDQLGERIGGRVLRSPVRLDDPARQLDEYFAGRRHGFELALDHALSSGFAAQVQAWLPTIGYGERASYADVAHRVGNPRAVRAVGTACARNPLPIVVPCHRVVRSDGSSGQYAGGTEAKIRLLDLESAPAVMVGAG